MAANTAYIYCDASFNKAEGLAVIGFAMFKSTQEHESTILREEDLHLSSVRESNNIRAELRAAIFALDHCLETHTMDQPVVIYTDCQNIVGLPSRRQKLEHNGFMSANTHQPLTNTDLYKEFFGRFDRVKPKLIWIKGHSPSRGRDHVQTNFSFLDRAVRKTLRDSLSI